MTDHPFETVDVFTDRLFGGNPLAVVLDARGLSDGQMQAIAREFNFSETTFLLPPTDPANTAKVRIFTPGVEVPFAGHPNVGTAFVLHRLGTIFGKKIATPLRFEEQAGLVLVDVEPNGRAIVTAPQRLSIGTTVPAAVAAPCLSLEASDIATRAHNPTVVSVGLPFLMVEVKSREALVRARIDGRAFAEHLPLDIAAGIHFYFRAAASDEVDLRARMFSPIDGVGEDPATGSANAALAGFLAALTPQDDLTLSLRIAQGVEMGRASLIDAEVIKTGGRIERVRIGGQSVAVMAGTFHVS
ncbi:MAG: PhzF family phenazine biosynthesis protein [Rhodospirillaceae bacterium]|nr:PhzF family phenazine biosynthesis protein [Rhodospirillaceae bacterium]